MLFGRVRASDEWTERDRFHARQFGDDDSALQPGMDNLYLRRLAAHLLINLFRHTEQA